VCTLLFGCLQGTPDALLLVDINSRQNVMRGLLRAVVMVVLLLCVW
jgi:hypothetical protein